MEIRMQDIMSICEQIIPERAIVERGNCYRLKECMKRAEEGGGLTIGFIGGSITQGSLASMPEYCYAYQVYEWWKQSFKSSVITYVNAGIGATDSQYGVARVHKDLLVHKPDVVIVEFSVNDEANSFYQETYESLLRVIYEYETKPAVIIVNNVCYDTGVNAQDFHNEIGSSYQIPCISMKECLYKEIQTGKLKVDSLTADNLHPNDCGHGVVAFIITKFLDTVRAEGNTSEEPNALPKASTLNAFMNSFLYQNTNYEPLLWGFTADSASKEGITDIFKHGWYAYKKGDRIRFELEASTIAIQYRKTIHKPTPIAWAIVDDDEEHPIILDGNFKETWGDCMYLETVLNHGKHGKHTLDITIIQTDIADEVPFYLVAVIGA